MKTFYRCSICGNLAYMLEESGMNPICCGKPMQKLIPGKTDASREKHIPVYKVKDLSDCREVCVQIGSEEHPMSAEHHISWIILVTSAGIYIKELEISQKPLVHFLIKKDEEMIQIFEYCNLHGLWVNEITKLDEK